MEARLLEVNQLATGSQSKLNETTAVIKSLEERFKTTEVCIMKTENPERPAFRV